MLPERLNDSLILTASSIRDFDQKRGEKFLINAGYDTESSVMKEYKRIIEATYIGKATDKMRSEFVARVMLTMYDVVKISEVGIYYIGQPGIPLYNRCRSEEVLSSYVSLVYQILFGFKANIQDATKYLKAGITLNNTMQCIDRRYIWVVGNYCWDKVTSELYTDDELPRDARVFAKMFDTDAEDEEIFKVPEFDDNQIAMMKATFRILKDKPYEEWDDMYHLQCFKDWSMDRPEVEFGMFTVLALPFMSKLPRGSIFNVGEGHNGKSVLVGLATSIVGKNNTTFVSGNQLSSWDNLVDLQTTFFNCPNETKVDFLKDDTDTFKSLSAHETISMRKKFGDATVPIVGDFPMVFNLNKLPDFGSDAPAILSRMFVNDFDCDFEATGKAIKDYARKTFLKDRSILPQLVGMIFAFAHYYNSEEHPWAPKSAMIDRREAIRETATPHTRYLYWFSKFFSGYAKISVLKDDYIKFGKTEGEDYDTSEIKLGALPFKKFSRSSLRDGTTVYRDGADQNSCVSRFIMYDDTYIRKYMGDMNISEMHRSSDESIVYKLMAEYLKRETEYKQQLELAGIEKDPKEIDKKILQSMFTEICHAQTHHKEFRKRAERGV